MRDRLAIPVPWRWSAAIAALVVVLAPVHAAGDRGPRPGEHPVARGDGDATPVAARSGRPPRDAVSSSAFEGWNVEVTPSSDDDQFVRVAFDSPLLRQRTGLEVWLPDIYESSPEPLPVAYYLHGTGYLHSFGTAQISEEHGLPTHPDFRRDKSWAGFGFAELTERQRYLVVALDMQDPAWCGYCWWVDGREGQGVPAESHLYEEVIPLVEHLFRVRTDRGGRALLGPSMGANGALLQAFRHPDRWTFAGAISPTYSGFGHPTPPLMQEHGTMLWWQYLAGQGYGPPATDEVHYRALDPVNLTPQMLGADVDLVAINGDGCVTHREGRCGGAPPTGDPFGEFAYNFSMGIWSSQLTELGVDHTWVQEEGTHAGVGWETFREFIIDRLNARFDEGVEDPAQFSYRTLDREFSIWGYDVAVDRPNDEFFSLLDAAADGSEVTLAGTGTATVTTPPVVTGGTLAGQPFEVVVTPDGEPSQRTIVTTDDSGRLTYAVTLGPPRDIDERIDLVRAGQFLFPKTRVTIVPVASADAA